MMDQVRKEYGDEALDGLVPPSQGQNNSSLELQDYDDSTFAPTKPQKSLLFYIATVQAFVIIYRTEVILGTVLALSVGTAISSSYHGRHRKVNPFKAAHIAHDYTTITSQYDLSIGAIDHWCLVGDDNNCRCEDPLVPRSKRSSGKWNAQHRENIKVAQAALMKLLASSSAWFDYEDYRPDQLDDKWIEGDEDDWVDGEGGRFDFGGDDYGNYDHWAQGGWDGEDDDGYGVPVEVAKDGDGRKLDQEVLDVVFIGDSLTEQRQGTSMGRPVEDWTGVKEVFGKTFTKEKGGDFNGIALGIAGDTAPNVLWRIINGEMPYGLTPKVWWLGVGINDLTMKGCSEEVALLGILRVVEEIQSHYPDDIIVINSLLPVKRNADGLLEHFGKHHEDLALKKKEKNLLDTEMSSKRGHIDFWPSISSINEQLSDFASAQKKVKFFNADSVFVEERQDGKYMKMELFLDPVHPNVAGHKKWNNAIKKRLHEILKDGN